MTGAAWFAAPYRSPYRNAEADFDAAIEDSTLRGLGVIEDDEPTEYSHHVHMRALHKRATGDFSRAEKAEIRARLGLGPWAAPLDKEKGERLGSPPH